MCNLPVGLQEGHYQIVTASQESESMELVAGIFAYGVIIAVTWFQLRGKVNN
jgi:hypothetical protein